MNANISANLTVQQDCGVGDHYGSAGTCEVFQSCVQVLSTITYDLMQNAQQTHNSITCTNTGQ
jgi:hypothetical protein